MAARKFKKNQPKDASINENKIFSASYNFPFGNINSRFLPTLKIILPLVVLFLISMLFLLFGMDGLNRVDKVLAISNPTNLKSGVNPNVAGVKKELEVKIVNKKLESPNFNATAVLAQDFDTGTILYQKDIHTKLAPASTTKLMTALVAVEHFKAGDMITVPRDAIVVGSTMGLRPGEKLTFRSLLYGMLLDSGNDAAYAIALNYPGGLNNFIDQMNLKTQEMGLSSTHFSNPAGFDGANNYSSAYDLSKIAKLVAQDYQLARIVATKDTQIVTWEQPTASLAAEKKREFNLRNLNQLLSEPGVLGMKTGTTEKAGENLVGLVERNGHKVITVMLGSENRFNETKQLMDWVYANYEWQ